MKPSTRLLLALVVIEAGLAGLWAWLMWNLRFGQLRPSGEMADTIATTSSVIGAAMGGLAVAVLISFAILRSKGK